VINNFPASFLNFRARFEYYLRKITSWKDRGLIQTSIKQFGGDKIKVPKLKEEIKTIYTNIFKSQAEGDLNTLRNYVTEYYVSAVKSQVFNKSDNKGLKAVWNGDITSIDVINWRKLTFPKVTKEFAQITFKIDSKQSFSVVNGKGEVVAGSTEMKPLSEYVVFERILAQGAPTTWRLCGKITPPANFDQPLPRNK